VVVSQWRGVFEGMNLEEGIVWGLIIWAVIGVVAMVVGIVVLNEVMR